jgi:hypothetical protein
MVLPGLNTFNKVFYFSLYYSGINTMFNNVSSLSSRLLLIIFVSATPFSVLADNTLIKSVDASGNVTYSDKPVTNAESVTNIPIQAGPSKGEIEAAKQQAKKDINTADKIKPDNKNKSLPQPSPAEEGAVYSGTNSNPPFATKARHHPAKNPGKNPPPAHRPVAQPRAGR